MRCSWRPVLAVAVVLPLVGCGAVDDLVGGGDEAPQVAQVAVMVPPDDPASEGVVSAVQAAVATWADDVPGWQVEVVVVDDGSGSGPGAGSEQVEDDLAGTEQRIRTAAEDVVDADVVAVVGGLGPDVVRTVGPVLGRAELIYLSPADADPTNTRGADVADPLRPFASYYRTSGGSDAAAIARWAVDQQGASQVVVADDGGDDAAAVVAEVRARGAEARAVPAAEEPERVALVEGIGAADLVVVPGSAATATDLAALLAAAEVDVSVAGNATLRSASVPSDAAAGADLLISLDLPSGASLSDRGQALAAQLRERDAGAPGRYGLGAYDAGLVVGDVLARCLPPAGSAEGSRRGCLAEMAQVAIDGAGGTIAFDEFGDIVDRPVPAWTLQGEQWETSDT